VVFSGYSFSFFFSRVQTKLGRFDADVEGGIFFFPPVAVSPLGGKP